MLFNYKPRFADLIVSGQKLQTIRLERKDGKRPQPGETLYHYTGLRTKNSRKLCESICCGCYSIAISEHGVYIDDVWLTPDEMDMLAQDDGFESFEVFMRFWRRTARLPFSGFMAQWKDILE